MRGLGEKIPEENPVCPWTALDCFREANLEIRDTGTVVEDVVIPRKPCNERAPLSDHHHVLVATEKVVQNTKVQNTRTPKKQATERDLKFNYGYETPRRLALLREQLTFVDPDCDYPTWRDVIWAILSTGYPSAYTIAREWSEGAPLRYSYLNFMNTADAYKPGHFTAGTIYHYARIGGWNG